jgi:predicted hydrolase (HD superfamily)
MVTLEDIENEIDPLKQTGVREKIAAKMKAGLMGNMISRLKKQESLLKEIPDVDGKAIIQALITGKRMLGAEEIEAVHKKFGTQGMFLLEGMQQLNTAQKQWIFKQMGWDINEVV